METDGTGRKTDDGICTGIFRFKHFFLSVDAKNGTVRSGGTRPIQRTHF